MIEERKQSIPARLKNMAIGGHVAGAEDIIDDHYLKELSQINQEVNLEINGTGYGLKDRLTSLEGFSIISVNGDLIELVNTPNGIVPGSTKVPTANAISGFVGYMTSNDGFIYAIADAENNIVAGIKADGSVEWETGIPTPIREYIESNISNIQEALETLRTEMSEMLIHITEYVDSKIEDLQEIGYIKNENWIYVITDSLDNILGGIDTEGQWHLKGIPTNEDIPFEQARLYDKIEATIDGEDNVLGYRKADGTRVENKIEIKDGISLGKGALRTLNDIGIGVSSDWSNHRRIELPMPKEGAIVNLIVPSNYSSSKYGLANAKGLDWGKVPESITDELESTFEEITKIEAYTNKTNEDLQKLSDFKNKIESLEEEAEPYRAYIEYWDKLGNYFKKPIVINGQGNSSMAFEINNLAIDFYDEIDYADGENSTLKIGNWPSLDSFHLKKFYLDAFRGQCNVAYKLMEEVMLSRDSEDIRPWSYTLELQDKYQGSGTFKEDYDSGAMAHPDGFPVELFLNGESRGVYTFNLKKHRDVYYMKKDNSKHILLDGEISPSFWMANGNLDNNFSNNPGLRINVWNDFEIRNPKTLCFDYDDFNQFEYDADKLTILLYNAEGSNIAGKNYVGQWDENYQTPEYWRVPFKLFLFDVPNLTEWGEIDNNTTNYDPEHLYETGEKVWFKVGGGVIRYYSSKMGVDDFNGNINVNCNPESEIESTKIGSRKYWWNLEYEYHPGGKGYAKGLVVKHNDAYYISTVDNNKKSPVIYYRINDIELSLYQEKANSIGEILGFYVNSGYAINLLKIKDKLDKKLGKTFYRLDITTNNVKDENAENLYKDLLKLFEGRCTTKIYNTNKTPDYKQKTECGWINCTVTVETRNAIERLSEAVPTINAIEVEGNEQETILQKRIEAEKYFNIPFLIDYVLLSNVLYHNDGFTKNWIWGTWDRKKWSPTLYDCDSIFGAYFSGNKIIYGSTESKLGTGDRPSNYMAKPSTSDINRGIFWNETKARYKELRDIGIFDVEHIVGLLKDWLELVGYDRLKYDLEEFLPNTPSYREPFIGDGWKIFNTNIYVLEWSPSSTYNVNSRVHYGNQVYKLKTGEVITYQRIIENTEDLSPENSNLWDLAESKYQIYKGKWNSSNRYNEGDVVYNDDPYIAYQSEINDNTNKPYPSGTIRDNITPKEGGFFNSIERVKMWLIDRIAELDVYYEYNQ